jgi:membrane-associated protein
MRAATERPVAPDGADGYSMRAMEIFSDFFSKLGELEELIRWGGYTVLFIIVFAETGLLVGFFLPGDSLLVTAGVFAARGHLDLLLLNVLLIVAAITGDTVGYWIGRKTGPALFSREKSRLFNPEHLRKTHGFYERHGGKTIVIARFMPIARTFAPVVAGMGAMDYRRFISFNVFGGIFWVTSMTGIGYFIGDRFPLKFVVPIVIFISILPGIIEYIRHRRRAAKVSSPLV